MAARKSRVYLDSIIPVTQTHDDVVTKFFRSGKFACTFTAHLQLIGIMCIVSNLVITILADYCHYHPCNKRLNIGSAVASISGASALYIIFSCGFVVSNPALWVRISIATNLTLSIITIVAQSVAMGECLTVTHIQKSPGPIALVGAGCLLFSCVTLFILYRFKELDEVIQIEEALHVEEQRRAAAVAADGHQQQPQPQRRVSLPASLRIVDDRHRIVQVHNEAFLPPPSAPSQPHRKLSKFIKHDDERRRSSAQCKCGSRKSSRDEPRTHATRYHHHGPHYAHGRQKVSDDMSVRSPTTYYGDDEFPHCFTSRRRYSYAKHMSEV